MSTTGEITTDPVVMIADLNTKVDYLHVQLEEMKLKNITLEKEKKAVRPKLPKPDTFDGAKGDIRTFLTQAKAYLKVYDSIDKESDKILCIGNLLTGKAMEWWEPTLRDYLDNKEPEDETARIFKKYKNFEEVLQTAFGDPDEVRTATRKLKSLKQTGSAQHYAREFRRIATKLDWDDDSQMELFYDGLREDVKDEIAKEDRPDDFDKFVEKIIKVDNRLYARRLERGGRYTGNRGNPPRRNQANTGKRRNGSTAYGTHPGPMELDATGKEKGKKCYNCGKTGHFANKCRAPKKQWKPVAEGKGLNAAHREDLPVRNISMVNSEEYFSDTDRFAMYDEPTSDEDWDFGTQPIPDEEEDLKTTELEVKESFVMVPETPPEENHANYNPRLVSALSAGPGDPEPMGVRIHGRDVSYPDALKWKIKEATTRASLEIYASVAEYPVLVTGHPDHEKISWASCSFDDCETHFWKKLEYRFFPRFNPDTGYGPFLETDLRDWKIWRRFSTHLDLRRNDKTSCVEENTDTIQATQTEEVGNSAPVSSSLSPNSIDIAGRSSDHQESSNTVTQSRQQRRREEREEKKERESILFGTFERMDRIMDETREKKLGNDNRRRQ